MQNIICYIYSINIDLPGKIKTWQIDLTAPLLKEDIYIMLILRNYSDFSSEKGYMHQIYTPVPHGLTKIIYCGPKL